MYLTNNDKDGNLAKLDFKVEIMDWKPDHMNLKFDLQDPLYVSTGISMDKIVLLIKDRKVFRSQINGKTIPDDGK